MLQALATSPVLDAGDYRTCDAQARDLVKWQGLDIVLENTAGRQQVNTRIPWGVDLPTASLLSDRSALAAPAPYVSDLFSSPEDGRLLVAVTVPVVRSGEIAYLVGTTFDPGIIARALFGEAVRPPYFASIADRTGRIVARSSDNERFAGRLEIEVTETILIHDEEALTTLHQLRTLGVRIALDDFGAGYTSLSYLRRFPFDKIKIDRSFVKDIDNPDTAAIVRAMVGLGARLGIAISAEGIETPEQLAHVRAEGCTEAQGYLICPPAPAREALALLTGRLGFVAA